MVELNPSSEPSREVPDFSRGVAGLLPAVAQDQNSGEVLMLAWMNRESYEETVRSGFAVYFSRSRNKLWKKGESSGHLQKVASIHVDCDADAILLKIEQKGAACHEGYRSCFFRQRSDDGWTVDASRIADPS